MSKGVEKLRLGPLPKTEVVKLTIAVSAATKSALDRYASLHSQLHGESVDATALIPHMLEAFIARDRGFKSLNAKSGGSIR
ncbi:MAG: DUF2274 domain-containing protein [Polaromonas sp.]|nr:DUF2274 domain-containing protein [Polaromonas sp.]